MLLIDRALITVLQMMLVMICSCWTLAIVKLTLTAGGTIVSLADHPSRVLALSYVRVLVISVQGNDLAFLILSLKVIHRSSLQVPMRNAGRKIGLYILLGVITTI